MQDRIAFPVLISRPDGLVVHTLWEPAWPRSASSWKRPNLTEDQKKAYQGQTSAGALKRLKAAIRLMIAQAEEKTAINFKTKKPYTYKVAFITLTLPAPQNDISDREIHEKCFIPWALRMKRRYGMKTYVWRRERQKNGNVHYHIIIDVYIDHANIRSHWNSCLEKLGFISRFHKKHGHTDPNSTDVHSIRKVKDLAAYMVKYIAKQARKKDTIDGRIWDCSKNLKTKEKCRIIGWGEDQKIIALIEQQLSHKKVDCGYSSYYPLSEKQKAFILPVHYQQLWHEYLKRVRNHQTEEPEPA